MTRFVLSAASIVLIAVAACAAMAQTQNVVITTTPLTGPDLGLFVGGTTTSTYTVDPNSGIATRTGGTAFPTTAKGGGINTITVTCTSCRGSVNNRTIDVTVTAAAPAGRFSITSFSRSNTTTTAGTTVTGSATGSPLTLTAVFPNNAATKTLSFQLGMTFAIAAAGGTGLLPVNYTVTASRRAP